MPWARPSPRLPPRAAKTVDGELMPICLANQPLTLLPRLVTRSLSLPILPVMPLMRPLMISPPMAIILPGRVLMPLMMLEPMRAAAEMTEPAMPAMPRARLAMRLRPMVSILPGNEMYQRRKLPPMRAAAEMTEPAMLTMPLARLVMRRLPSCRSWPGSAARPLRIDWPRPTSLVGISRIHLMTLPMARPTRLPMLSAWPPTSSTGLRSLPIHEKKRPMASMAGEIMSTSGSHTAWKAGANGCSASLMPSNMPRKNPEIGPQYL